MIDITKKIRTMIKLDLNETCLYIKQKIETQFPDMKNVKVSLDYSYDKDELLGIIITADTGE